MIKLINKLFLLLISLLSFINSIALVNGAARTIKIPLMRSTTLKAGQYGQPVTNYYTPISIGTPAVDFMIQFDVNLSDSLVPHYTFNPFKTYFHYSKGFQCKSSSTCARDNREYVIDYQSCKLTGKSYEDFITFKSAKYNDIINNNNNISNHSMESNNSKALENGITITQKFLAISDVSDGRFKDLPIDGFVGLSPQTHSLKSGILNPLLTLYQAKLIDTLQFSFWINPILDSSQGGELTLGGVDVNRYQGQIYWHHLSNSIVPNEWSINLQFVSLSNQFVSCQQQQCQVILSSALNDCYGPSNDVENIYKLLNATRTNSPDQLRYVNCQNVPHLPYLTFSIDGIPYAMLSTNYIRKTSDGKCYVAILPTLNEPTQKRWILSTTFLGAYYTTFDLTQKQVGFATLR